MHLLVYTYAFVIVDIFSFNIFNLLHRGAAKSLIRITILPLYPDNPENPPPVKVYRGSIALSGAHLRSQSAISAKDIRICIDDIAALAHVDERPLLTAALSMNACDDHIGGGGNSSSSSSSSSDDASRTQRDLDTGPVIWLVDQLCHVQGVLIIL
jgi:hypothetical protein